MNLLDKIIRYESGETTEQGDIELFQELVDNGMEWTLQGHYGRTATAMLDAGLIKPRQKKGMAQ